MKKIAAILPLICLLLGSTSGSHADSTSVGVVRTVAQDAYILRDETSVAVKINMKIMKGDVLKTGPTGSLGMIFQDDTLVSMGPDSELAVKDFLFDPSNKKLSFVIKMLQGTFSYLSGQISKLLPDAVHLETPDATIGTRGTHVLVKVEGR